MILEDAISAAMEFKRMLRPACEKTRPGAAHARAVRFCDDGLKACRAGLQGHNGLETRSMQGKCMRGRLLLALALAMGKSGGEAESAARAVELLHAASLVIDDMMDQSPRRRSGVSLHCRIGNEKAAIAAQALVLGAALELLGAEGGRAALGRAALLCDAVAGMAKGQMLDISPGRVKSMGGYRREMALRTGSAFRLCCLLAADICGADAATARRLARLGDCIGVLFQMRDDIMDYWGGSGMGKPLFADFENGKITLPVIAACGHSVRARHDALALLRKEKKGISDRERMLAILRATRALEKCGSLAQKAADGCKAQIRAIPGLREKKRLCGFIDGLLARPA